MTAHHTAPTLLLIDDQHMAADLVHHLLHDQTDIRFHYLATPEQALTRALEVQPNVILVDLKMPGLDGFGVIDLLRSRPATQTVPIILLSSEDDPDVKARGFAAGINDYLVKWPDKRELVARLRYHASAYVAHCQRDEAFSSLRQSQDELLLRTRQLAASQAALHQAQKMEAIGQLTGGVAHDFNNVLQIISGNLQLLKMLNQGNEPVLRRINAAASGVERGARLAAHLLAFARRQPLQSVVTDAGAVLRNMGELLRRSLGEAIELRLDIAEPLWSTLADPCQLENVILNLAINARDAMAASGSLRIRACNAGPGGEVQMHPAGSRGRFVMIEVSDSGCGMAPEVLERAFEPFFTTKPAGQGTGLGLSMAYGFVKQSGGHITLDSEPGSGTAVRIFLPQTEGTAQAPEPTLSPGPIFGGVETVLVVEDEPEVRATTVELLTSLGYLTLQAEDGASALHMIESGVPIDLVFTDVVMPGKVKCRELAARARELHPRAQVLFTSGYADGMLDAEGGRLDPHVSLLQKPYTADALAQRIRHLLRRRPLVAASVA